jgi:hypothetical protein
MNAVVGADGDGAARGARAQARPASNQLHDRSRNMVVKSLILRD